MRKMVTTKITQWGNSFGLRLPKGFVYGTNIPMGKPLEISMKPDRSILVREAKNVGAGLSKDYFVRAFKRAKPIISGEFSWGRPHGKEIW